MDFENSWIVKPNECIELFWANLSNMISRLNWDLEDGKKNKVNFINLSNITTYIDKQKEQNANYFKANKIIQMINELPIKLVMVPQNNFVYNPNFF